ncbi:hypothetical protein KOR42_15380 [Thalassoglobus neptunius]|uniref:Uncharacterized protein n=2 Tax=Thalassoglobus neptunius TaxID=1938619 RepID=A0A5C5X4X6_9PLAN|nr:hypothetical protein KOR42_15380 [Thalassoglobus neptunius]
MFGFAFMMIAMLFLYWELYTKPFRSLQYAIAAEFPDSSPKVIGGQHKSHKDISPVLLRVVVYVPDKDFDPTTDDAKSEVRALDLVRLAFENHDVDQYEQIDVVLLQKVPEGARKRWSIARPVDEWRAELEASGWEESPPTDET